MPAPDAARVVTAVGKVARLVRWRASCQAVRRHDLPRLLLYQINAPGGEGGGGRAATCVECLSSAFGHSSMCRVARVQATSTVVIDAKSQCSEPARLGRRIVRGSSMAELQQQCSNVNARESQCSEPACLGTGLRGVSGGGLSRHAPQQLPTRICGHEVAPRVGSPVRQAHARSRATAHFERVGDVLRSDDIAGDNGYSNGCWLRGARGWTVGR